MKDYGIDAILQLAVRDLKTLANEVHTGCTCSAKYQMLSNKNTYLLH